MASRFPNTSPCSECSNKKGRRPRRFLFSVGGAGDPPASLGDSPSGTGEAVRLERSANSFPTRLAIPSGEVCV